MRTSQPASSASKARRSPRGISAKALPCETAKRRSTSTVRAALAEPRSGGGGEGGVTAKAFTEARSATAASSFTRTRTAAEVVELTAGSIGAFLDSQGGRLVVVDYFTPLCGPCKIMTPVFEEMAQEFRGVAFAKFDCGMDTANKQHAIGAGIKALPTFHVYHWGTKVGEICGAKAEKLRSLVNQHC